MKKRSLITIIISLVICSILTGCSVASDTTPADKLQPAKQTEEDKVIQTEENEIKEQPEEANGDSDEVEEKPSEEEESYTADPLAGLVANDILTKFRESNAVVNSASVEDEAFAFGSWVQKNIDKIPNSVREKGDEIGRRYEFWFGTDIGNNFEDNFPRIYKAYYSLKDYYTSDGERGRDFYESVSEENDFLGNGDPENIENMYSDMRDFITDCNNIIRNK